MIHDRVFVGFATTLEGWFTGFAMTSEYFSNNIKTYFKHYKTIFPTVSRFISSDTRWLPNYKYKHFKTFWHVFYRSDEWFVEIIYSVTNGLRSCLILRWPVAGFFFFDIQFVGIILFFNKPLFEKIVMLGTWFFKIVHNIHSGSLWQNVK